MLKWFGITLSVMRTGETRGGCFIHLKFRKLFSALAKFKHPPFSCRFDILVEKTDYYDYNYFILTTLFQQFNLLINYASLVVELSKIIMS